MGIPTYFRVITQQYAGIIRTTCPNVCNHFFVDFNGLIHQSAYAVLDNIEKDRNKIEIEVEVSNKHIETSIIEKTWDYLNGCIKYANPTNVTYTCIDGVAPIAKMSQQRKRRYLTVLNNKLLGIKPIWDRNAISPGTAFMINLEAYMNKQFREKGTNGKLNYFSGSNEPGEGEHKLFAILNTISKNEVAVVYGLDADLIMLSLMSHHPKIYLMREPQHVQKDLVIDNKVVTNESFIYLDIHLLRVNLIKELADTYYWNISSNVLEYPYCNEANDIIESYVTVCSLLGNDFLPHIPSLSLKKNGHTRLLLAVKNAWDKTQTGPPVLSGKINVDLMKELLKILSKDEDTIFFKMNEEYLKKKPFTDDTKAADDPIHCYAIQPKNKDQLAQYLYNTHCNAWRIYYYKTLFHCRLHDMNTVNNACDEFIKGIFWVYHYYKRLPKDPKWVYPYNYSPTVLDLANYLEASCDTWSNLQSSWNNISTQSIVSSKLSNQYVTRSPLAAVSQEKNLNTANAATVCGFVSSVIQLLSIIPPESVDLLPHTYQKFMTDSKYGCKYLYPSVYPVQTYLKTHLWECTPVLPQLDIDLLEKIVSENKKQMFNV